MIFSGPNFFDSLREASRSLMRARLRTLIGLTGIAIGIASVITMLSTGEIATKEARKKFQALGTDIIVITPEYNSPMALEDALSLAAVVPAVSAASPIMKGATGFIHASTQVGQGALQGVTAAFAGLNKLTLQSGRFLSDLDGGSSWCVIGATVADNIRRTGTLEVLGTEIEIDERFYRVIGVLAPMENNYALSYQPNANESVFVHISTIWQISAQAAIQAVIARATRGVDPNAAVEDIQRWFRTRNPRMQLTVESAKQLLEQMESQLGTMTLLLGAVGSISLLVGGIGVMNIMLMSVTERRREIGIRRAIGAARADIQNQFLLESMILTLIGGVMGLGFGAVATWSVCHYYTHWQFFISPLSIVVGIGVSSAVGIFFGIQPAYQASRLDPIVALQGQ